MALNATALTPVSAFTANVYPPQANSDVESNDVEAGEQALLNRTEWLNDNKLNLTGGVLTGQLQVLPTTAVEGVVTSGGTGQPGLITTNGTTQTVTAPTCAGQCGGFFQLTGADPNKGVDPGANDAIHGANITKAWGVVSLTGGTPFTTTDDYNVVDVTEPIANIYQINFVRAFSNATYAITFTPHAPGIGVSLSTKTTTTCRFNVWDTTAPGTPVPNQTVDFVAVGRQ
jgi:hypothetical protein